MGLHSALFGNCKGEFSGFDQLYAGKGGFRDTGELPLTQSLFSGVGIAGNLRTSRAHQSTQSVINMAGASHLGAMQNNDPSTSAQLRADASKTRTHASTPDPAASPLGTDDEAAGVTPSADRVEMAREAERKLETAKRKGEASRTDLEGSTDKAQLQRGSNAPYAKEDHMNQELAKRAEAERSKENAF